MPASTTILAPPENISTPRSSARWDVPVILAISLLLRWILILRGGQYYFSDEQRYETSRAVADLTLQGNFSQAASSLFTAPEHVGFKIIGIIPAVLETLTRESLVLPALFFGIFSLLNLYLIYQISKRLDASSKEALYALLVSAASVSLLYFTRHLMPYDTAMTFGLLALYAALTKKPTAKSSLACGGSSFLCFITYNGYWPLAALAMLVHVLPNPMSLRGGHSPTNQSQTRMDNFNIWAKIFLRKGLLTAAGFILPAILLFLAAKGAGVNLLTEYRTFATTVSQGSFAEGWSLPFEYFWHTEHILFIMMGVSSLYALVGSRSRNKSLKIVAASLVFIYLCLFIPSVIYHSFVVYGRLARQMIPFLAILSASGLERLEQDHPSAQRLVKIAFILIFIQAAWNYSISYNLSYPREFSQKAQALYPDFDFSEKRLAFGAPTLCHNNGYIIENVKYFVTPPDINPPVQGELLLSASHPDNFLPYQYEGYTYEERQTFRELDLQMRLYKTDSSFTTDASQIRLEIKNCVVKDN